MSEFQIIVEWESPGGAMGPDLRATWARLRIEIGGKTVTRVEDKVSKSVRDGIYLPLYPLAQWMVTNWWPLLFEVSSTGRESNGYRKRHSFSAAREGYALPDLRLEPEGESVSIEWNPVELPQCRVGFLSSGEARIDRSELESSLTEFLNAVDARLKEQDLPDSFISEEWQAITGADREERAFCEAAGKLGWDPYDLSDEESRAIVEVSEKFPSDFCDELFASAERKTFRDQVEKVELLWNEANESAITFDALRDIRNRGFNLQQGRFPWEEGYDVARQLRECLQRSDPFIRNVQDLWTVLSIDSSEPSKVIKYGQESLGSLYCLVSHTGGGGPFFAFAPPIERVAPFALCRALFEYLVSQQGSPALVTSAHSERQKRNRAFAAEFLAPASEIGKHLRSQRVGEEEILEISEEFGISEWIIRHQIKNHNLAIIDC